MFGAIASIAGPLLGASMQADATGDAIAAQTQSSAAAIGEQRRQYDQTRRDTAPYREAGGAAVLRLRDLLGIGQNANRNNSWAQRTGTVGAELGSTGDPVRDRAIALYNRDLQNTRGYGLSEEEFSQPAVNQQIQAILASGQANLTPEEEATHQQAQSGQGLDSPLTRKFTVADFYDDPVTKLGMEFGLGEGRKAIDRMAGAGGLRNSGGTLKALTKFGTDYAGTKAADSENRFKNYQDRIFNMFSGVAGTGQTATTNTAAMGGANAGNIGNIMTGEGNARGAAAIAGGNAWGNAFNTVGSWWNQKQTMDKLFPNGITGYGGSAPASNSSIASMYNFGN